jgi:protein SCO1
MISHLILQKATFGTGCHPELSEAKRRISLNRKILRLRLRMTFFSLFAVLRFFLVILVAASLLAGAYAQMPNAASIPEPLREVGIDQKLDDQIPLDLSFSDEMGREVKLSQYFGQHPVILVFAYYECPMLCTLVLNGVLRALRVLQFTAGKDFEVVIVSFNPKETPELAKAKKDSYLENYNRPLGINGWHFLTGKEPSIKALTNAAGFHYKYDAERDQYIHASGIMVLTPQGKLARYFYGVEYSARDLRLAIVESSAGKIGSPVDQVLLYCYHYDPLTGKYGVAAMNLIRLLAIATVVALATFMIISFRRDRVAQKT